MPGTEERNQTLTTKPPTVRQQATKLAAALPTEHIKCRLRSHDWAPYDVGTEGKFYVQLLRCQHGCEVVKVEVIHRTSGALTRRRYRYPSGYLLPVGSATQDFRNSLRLRLIKQTIAELQDRR